MIDLSFLKIIRAVKFLFFSVSRFQNADIMEISRNHRITECFVLERILTIPQSQPPAMGRNQQCSFGSLKGVEVLNEITFKFQDSTVNQ